MITVTRTADSAVATGASAAYKTNILKTGWQLGFGVIVTGGSPTYKVQHCYNTTSDIDAGTATWFDHSVVTGKTVSFDGNYNATLGPVSGVRVLITAGTGTVTMLIVQPGNA